jgi:two-component system, oxyanion-binding sensor
MTAPETSGAARRGGPVLHAGFMPLVDAAALIAAARLGFAQAEGITIALHRETSWATVRDKVAVGRLDAAQMLAPMPIAAALGLQPGAARLVAPVALGRNGNAFTVSTRLWRAMAEHGATEDGDPASTAAAFAAVVRQRAGSAEPMALGVVFHVSSHRYELRDWLVGAGLDPDRDVRLPVVPPPFMVGALEEGLIDGFYVGEPWSSAAVLAGHGRLVTTKAHLRHAALEKVLGLRADWVETNEDAALALIRAIVAAAEWCDRPENRRELAALLASADGLDAPLKHVEAVLLGSMPIDRTRRLAVPDAIIFHRGGATLPTRDDAAWIYEHMVRAGEIADSADSREAALSAFRPDLYRRAMGG